MATVGPGQASQHVFCSIRSSVFSQGSGVVSKFQSGCCQGRYSVVLRRNSMLHVPPRNPEPKILTCHWTDATWVAAQRGKLARMCPGFEGTKNKPHCVDNGTASRTRAGFLQSKITTENFPAFSTCHPFSPAHGPIMMLWPRKIDRMMTCERG